MTNKWNIRKEWENEKKKDEKRKEEGIVRSRERIKLEETERNEQTMR